MPALPFFPPVRSTPLLPSSRPTSTGSCRCDGGVASLITPIPEWLVHVCPQTLELLLFSVSSQGKLKAEVKAKLASESGPKGFQIQTHTGGGYRPKNVVFEPLLRKWQVRRAGVRILMAPLPLLQHLCHFPLRQLSFFLMCPQTHPMVGKVLDADVIRMLGLGLDEGGDTGSGRQSARGRSGRENDHGKGGDALSGW